MLIYAAEAGLVNCNGAWAKLISGRMVLLSSCVPFRCFFSTKNLAVNRRSKEGRAGKVDVWLNLGMDDLHSNILPWLTTNVCGKAPDLNIPLFGRS